MTAPSRLTVLAGPTAVGKGTLAAYEATTIEQLEKCTPSERMGCTADRVDSSEVLGS